MYSLVRFMIACPLAVSSGVRDLRHTGFLEPGGSSWCVTRICPQGLSYAPAVI